jgi:hypothetical protein
MIWLLVIAGKVVGLAALVGTAILWLTGRDVPPHRDDCRLRNR